MFDHVQKLHAEYQELQQKLQDPVVFQDHTAVAKIQKRLAEIEPLMPLVRQYIDCTNTIQEAQEIQEEELKDIAQEEAQKAQQKLPVIEEQLKKELSEKDPLDERNVIIEVRAGTGGEEAALFAAELLRMYLRYAEKQGWKTELLDKSDAESGGVKEAIVHIEGIGAFGKLKHEGGVHRVQRIPETENKGRVHTSAASVAILPEAEEQDIEIRTEDLRMDTYRASGAGGQHVNKTESAVRITHIPSGVVVACQSERSQFQNRARAMEHLRSKLYQHQREQEAKERGDLRSAQVKSGDRSDKIRTYNFPQDRVTDHRLGKNFHNLPGIMEGNLDPIITVLQEERDKEMNS
ncbi:peptide chain release factor 1 [Candidatus Peregrinibacteria bacterium CG10_big_fil_rev_8_21_14_0_10_49_16]|nr:MAG: peptide chain release factor 1 [Candidatus Peregrinibacteria bacterium CG10_big_fil_rev_8_21_14_0_10_49_16]